MVSQRDTKDNPPAAFHRRLSQPPQRLLPVTNYTLSTVCPACNAPTFRHACKVRCSRCGFMWDCSEL